MQADVYSELYEDAIYSYGSSELELCVNRLTKYFSREFKRHQSIEPDLLGLLRKAGNLTPIGLRSVREYAHLSSLATPFPF